jgi:hypothetical protein
VVKPEHSRVINAEKYIVFSGFKKNELIAEKINDMCEKWEENKVFDCIIENCKEFEVFLDFINEINEKLIRRTISALESVIKRVSEKIYDMHLKEQRRQVLGDRQPPSQIGSSRDRYA